MASLEQIAFDVTLMLNEPTSMVHLASTLERVVGVVGSQLQLKHQVINIPLLGGVDCKLYVLYVFVSKRPVWLLLSTATYACTTETKIQRSKSQIQLSQPCR